MPELPEVETTCCGIRPHLCGQTVRRWILRDGRLRWPVPDEFQQIEGQPILAVERRAKYILLRCPLATAIVHLGMSGSLRICESDFPWRKHDHVALELENGKHLRYHDPRRFGCWLWTDQNPAEHPLLRTLGPEPLDRTFNGDYLHGIGVARKIPVKQLIMDAHVVVGVGNIYACEALFFAGIHPLIASKLLSEENYGRLVRQIRKVLRASIREGGTTLRDFLREDGRPGYFRQRLQVYGREGEPCRECGQPVGKLTLAQRSTFYCSNCQKISVKK